MNRHNMKLNWQFENLLFSMIDANPKKRPDIDQIRNHPWMW